ncbi:hypothetical protein OQ435_12915 [Proteus penneri]|nr:MULTISPECIES: hypothetical protein [Proteus]MCX2589067.1 hypothetical protein [Proteus penneri]
MNIFSRREKISIVDEKIIDIIDINAVKIIKLFLLSWVNNFFVRRIIMIRGRALNKIPRPLPYDVFLENSSDET